MTLAEALSLRKELETQITTVRDLLMGCSMVQEGDVPTEEPETLMKELDGLLKQLKHYVYCINVTNMNITDEDGNTMTKLLAERDILKKRIEILNYTFKNITNNAKRSYRTEIKNVVTIDMKAMRTNIRRLSQQYRQLDMKIQKMNYVCELVTS